MVVKVQVLMEDLHKPVLDLHRPLMVQAASLVVLVPGVVVVLVGCSVSVGAARSRPAPRLTL